MRYRTIAGQPTESAAVKDQRRGSVGVGDRVDPKQRDRVVARLDFAVEAGFEMCQTIRDDHRAVRTRCDVDLVEPVLRRTGQLARQVALVVSQDSDPKARGAAQVEPGSGRVSD